MNPKLALIALAGAMSLSGCYYVPYGYYPGYPAAYYPGGAVVGTAQVQQGYVEAPSGASGATVSAQGSAPATYPTAQPPVYPDYSGYYAPYPAYYGAYPAYGYGYPYYGYPYYGYPYSWGPSVGLYFGGGWGPRFGGGFRGRFR